MEEISKVIQLIGTLLMLGLFNTIGIGVFYSVRALINYVRYKNIDANGVRTRGEMKKAKKLFLMSFWIVNSISLLAILDAFFDESDTSLSEDTPQVEVAEEPESLKIHLPKIPKIFDESDTNLSEDTPQVEVAEEPKSLKTHLPNIPKIKKRFLQYQNLIDSSKLKKLIQNLIDAN